MVVNRRIQISMGVFAVVVGFFAVAQLVSGVQRTYLRFTGLHGSVVVSRCDHHTNDRPATFACYGTFTSDDASVQATSVRLQPDRSTRPTGTVPARIAGPGGHDALADGEFAWAGRLVGASVFGAMATGAGAALVRTLRLPTRRLPPG